MKECVYCKKNMGDRPKGVGYKTWEDRKYCSQTCSAKDKYSSNSILATWKKGKDNRVSRECSICGKIFKVYQKRIDKGEGKVCSQECLFRRREIESLGNKYIDSQGYIKIHLPRHCLADCKGNVSEHRLKVFNYLKKNLEKNIVIHHIDKNKSNNNLENLKILTNSEHMRLHNLEK